MRILIQTILKYISVGSLITLHSGFRFDDHSFRLMRLAYSL